MNTEAAQKINDKFEGLDIDSLSDQHYVKFFQYVDSVLPEGGKFIDLMYNYSSIINRVTYKLRNRLHLMRQRTLNMDEFNNHELNNLPTRIKDYINEHIIQIEYANFEIARVRNKITQIGGINDFIAIADNTQIKIIKGKSVVFELDVSKYSKFTFSEDRFILFVQENPMVKVLFYNLKDFTQVDQKSGLLFCPSYVKCIAKDVFQFIHYKTVGNIVFANDKCDVKGINLVKTVDIPSIGDYKFADPNYYLNNNKLMVKVCNNNYNLICSIRQNCGYFNVDNWESIKKSKMFSELDEFMKHQYELDMKEMLVKVDGNSKFFK